MGNRHFDPHLNQVAGDRGHKQRMQNDGHMGDIRNDTAR